jgi:predicted PurR-regulated permease PerM
VKRKKAPSNLPIIIGAFVVLLAIVGITLIVWLAKTNQTAPDPTQAPLAITPEGQRVQSQAAKLSEQPQASQPQQFQNVVVDGMGRTGKFVVDYLDLVVLLIVLSFMIQVFLKIGKMWRD